MKVWTGPAYNRHALYSGATTVKLAAWWSGWAQGKRADIPADVLMLLARADGDEFEVEGVGRELLFGGERVGGK